MALTHLTKVSKSFLPSYETITPNLSTLDRSKLGEVTFSDDFKNSQLFAWAIPANSSPQSYISNTPWAGNFGEAAYSQPGDGTTAITFNEPLYGGLKLSLYQDSNYANAWYGGLISSVDCYGNGFSATDGYWEITAKLPTNTNQGAWFAFWVDSFFPASTYDNLIATEYDVIEWYSVWPNSFHSVYHIYENVNPYPFTGDKVINLSSLGLSNNHLSSTFNTYGVLFTNSLIRCYINDIQYASIQRSEFSKLPMGFLIDIAGGGASGQNSLVNGTGPFDAYVTQFSYSPYIG